MADANSLDEYSNGAIRWLKLHNFMTYGEFECHFGPTLNLFVAPNGTGKSAIVNAICLVLGGSPKFLARADKLSSYVKTGCEKGSIEIGLLVDKREMCIKRVLKFNSESTEWFLNSRPATEKNIMGIVNRHGIQVENLCQFLPQDRTADFARMNNIDRLQCVEETVGTATLRSDHERLVLVARDLAALSRNLEQRETELNELRARDEAFRTDVELAKARDANELRLKWTERKRCYVEVQRRSADFEATKANLKRVKDRLDSEIKSRAAFEQKVASAKDALSSAEKTAKAQLAELNTARRTLTNAGDSCSSELEKVADIEAGLARKRDAVRKHREKLDELTQHLAAYRAALRAFEQEYAAELADAQALDTRVRTLQADRTARSRELNDTVARLDADRHDLHAVNAELTSAQQELHAIRSVGEQRLAALDAFNMKGRDTRDAVQWLRANRSRFRGEVCEPIALLLSVSDQRDAKFVEQLIPGNELLMFLFQYDEDLELFSREIIDRQRKSVNLARAVGENEQFQSPYSIAELQRFGFVKWIRDCCVAPPIIISYLCRRCNIHLVPIGTERTAAPGQHERITRELPTLSRYFTASDSFSMRRSRYSNDVSTQVVPVRDPRILRDSRNTQRESQLEQIIQQSSQRRATLERNVQQSENRKKQLDDEVESLREQIKRLSQVRSNKTKQEEQIRGLEEQLESMRDPPFDIRAEERNARDAMRAIYRTVLERLANFNESVDASRRGVLKQYATAGLTAQQAAAQMRGIERRIREHRETIEAQMNEQASLKQACLDAKRGQDEAYRKLTSILGLKEGSQLDEPTMRMFNSYPDDIDELDEKIAQLRAQIQCAALSGDRQAITDAKKRAERIAKLNAEVSREAPRRDELAKQVDSLRTSWLTPLNSIIERVDRQFARFCKQLGARGTVRLAAPPATAVTTTSAAPSASTASTSAAPATVSVETTDFDRYELQIRCAFRENDDLYELNGGTQSGGERSVATILFMLSLQQLTRVPFRCIDEINQGMDPVNERRVFDLVVQTACRDTKSQYFMFTPKLLPKLRYSSRMNVIVIYNGKRAVQKSDMWLNQLLDGDASARARPALASPTRASASNAASTSVVSNSTPASRKRAAQQPSSPSPSFPKHRRV